MPDGRAIHTRAAKYQTIVADPPWPHEGFAALGTGHLINGRKRTYEERGPIGAQPASPMPYPTMSISEIAALPIPQLSDKNCRLFLWATNRHLPDAFDLMRHWDFIYRQTFVWDKTPNVNPLGGSLSPNAAEYLIVGVNGTAPRKGRWHTNIIRSRKARPEHSRKPDVFLDMVEATSPGPYLEMFARRNRLGWDTWGNEALEHVEVGA
jgi:N6-adenosine-specific RNA methylase IME4